MRSAHRPPHYEGLYFDEFAEDSAWIREHGLVRLPLLADTTAFVLEGEFLAHPDARGLETGPLGADVWIDGQLVTRLRGLKPGPFEVRFAAKSARAGHRPVLQIRLRGTAHTNFLAWLGRAAAGWPGAGAWQRFRQQNKNRQFRVSRLATADGEVVFDFSTRHAPFSAEFARRRTHLGLNIAGFLTADLGIGESARCMVRAADAANLATALVDAKLHCKNRRGDPAYQSRLTEHNPYPGQRRPPRSARLARPGPPPSRIPARQVQHRLPGLGTAEFPDAWVPYFDYFDEICARANSPGRRSRSSPPCPSSPCRTRWPSRSPPSRGRRSGHAWACRPIRTCFSRSST